VSAWDRYCCSLPAAGIIAAVCCLCIRDHTQSPCPFQAVIPICSGIWSTYAVLVNGEYPLEVLFKLESYLLIFHTCSLLQIHVKRVQNTVFQQNKSSLHADASLKCPSVHVKEQLLHAAMHMLRPWKWRQLYSLADVIHRGVIERRSGSQHFARIYNYS
jgi:hypothetical protein